MSPTLKQIRIAAVMMILISFTQCKKVNYCTLKPETGNCKASIPRLYFDQDKKECKQFIWGGCDGVVPFATMEECSKQCK